MPRCPAKDYADRCKAIELRKDMLTHPAIAQTLHRPERWVRRTLARHVYPEFAHLQQERNWRVHFRIQ